MFLSFASGVFAGALIVIAYLYRPKPVVLPPHLLHNPAFFVPNLLTKQQAQGLRDVALNQIKTFENIAKDNNFYTSLHEHIGEAEALNEDGTCSHPFLVPNANNTLCILPGRVDVAQHFVRTGGVQALREKFDISAARLQSFASYIFDVNKYPIIKELFASKVFTDNARSVCPPDEQYLDTFQMNFILQVPGQTVAIHTDAPYFHHATRFQFPQWLLVAMTHSGLFKDDFVHQVQVVAYFHEWKATATRGGQFLYWKDNATSIETLLPEPEAGTVVDGSKTVHCASVYGGPHGGALPPPINKQEFCQLKHVGNDVWQVVCNDKVLQTYSTDDLRFAIVYRARCFRDEQTAREFRERDASDMLQLEQVLSQFRTELERRGRLEQGEQISRLDLALLIINEFIRYPTPTNVWIPLNYCALSKLVPATKPLLDLIC
mmetsp:Transcript_10773/g.17998  ORF Transcript_10773/g.17998 Transcript_10773/m.17998 type:complete len:433 (+) Transcript_10773:1797-3095(+)